MELDEKSLEVIKGIVNRTGLDDAEKRLFVKRLRKGECGYGINLPINYCTLPLLHVLAAENKADEIGLLLSSCPGIDVNVRSRNGYTPLHSALINGCMDAALVLMDSGGVNIDAVNHGGYGTYPKGTTPLHIACRKGNGAAIKALLDHGADMFLSDDRGKAAFKYCEKTLRPLFKDAMERAIES